MRGGLELADGLLQRLDFHIILLSRLLGRDECIAQIEDLLLELGLVFGLFQNLVDQLDDVGWVAHLQILIS